jgi:hypothetical protein
MSAMRLIKSITCKYSIIVLLATLLVSGTIFTPASADEDSKPGFLFILDASGSMWGRLDGTEKIVIAKDVMKEVIEGLPADSALGLEVYGHRKEGDCGDIEVISDLGTTDRAELLARLESLIPKGKTPLQSSLKTAETLLKEREDKDKVTIILVSDGKETCGGDPCATTAQIMQSGINTQIHVVGFDVDEEERAELGCIAAEGGGEYFSASSGEQLLTALTTIGAETLEPPPQQETLWIDTYSSRSVGYSGPVSGTWVLEAGRSYEMTTEGTFNVWASPTKLCRGKSLGLARHPSARRTTCETIADAGYLYGVSATSATGCKLTLPFRLESGLELSLDGGATWTNHQAIENAPSENHLYHYNLVGQGHPLMARFVDKPTDDNCGRLRVVLRESG